MSGHIRSLKPLDPEPCPYFPGEDITAHLYALTSVDPREFPVFSKRVSDMTRPARLEGVRKGFLAVSFGAVAPVCANCNACVPLRVNTEKFTMTASQRSLMGNGSLQYHFGETAVLNPHELYRVFRDYTAQRHNEKESTMRHWTPAVFRDWLACMPYMMTVRNDAQKLLGFATLEAAPKDAILEYIAYDLDYAKLSIGKRLWLQTMQDAKTNGVDHVYVGSWAKNSPKLDYKKNFSGLETFDGKQWVDFDPDVHTSGPNYCAMLKREGFDLSKR